MQAENAGPPGQQAIALALATAAAIGQSVTAAKAVTIAATMRQANGPALADALSEVIHNLSIPTSC